ncbi:phosphoribosylanthranilate isomerase [Rhodococcus rhodnii]|uniref:N-(5'-phosphoribosyl)anthranilate isomerase n=2 Tax=Rhodococcus rhodnii TaxID=38312 RepID=R7WQT1_9NOCA|nr:phosphoribosylanthranilate isomerase [Rhodococcus rhodnii]EOM76314.1 phosphoribosylanthranilate isomerase [Rhodococcus rhodnii LMG 5362]TXG89989.1 phosphoribosylanthranilate isomerase [Rhodococcus rhodnii]
MTFIKVCGLRDAAAVDAAVAAGADAVGFVFAPRSVRAVAAAEAAALVDLLPATVEAIGVFQDASAEDVVRTVRAAGIGTAQVHGAWSSADTEYVRGAGVRVVRAVVAGSHDDDTGAERLLVDGAVAGAGRTWDWSGALPATERWILAGGLDPDNVEVALRVTGAWGVDVSSGVESSRGVKDVSLIARFVAAARSAAA